MTFRVIIQPLLRRPLAKIAIQGTMRLGGIVNDNHEYIVA